MTIRIGEFDVLIDDEDYDKIKGKTWWTRKIRYYTYFRTPQYLPGGRRHMINLHRVIMDAPEGLFVDHINGNTLDNRKCNLRLCTQKENLRNRRVGKNNTSGYKGVTKGKYGNWRSVIKVDMKKIYLGSFKEKEDAYKAYCEAATKYFGEYAKLD